MRRVAALIVGVGCALASACSASDGAAAPGVEASLHRSRLFETQRKLALNVHPDGDRDVRVGAIQLDSPLFETVPPESRDALVRTSDQTVVMPLPFGAARCDQEADGPAELVTDVDGEEVRIPLDESPSDMLADVHAAECDVAAIRADVDLRMSGRWERTAPRTVEGELELVQRRPGVTAAVDQVEGNVIFTVGTGTGSGSGESAPEPVLEVSDDQTSDRVVAVAEASRCDPHALTEYKRTFTFSAWVTVADEAPLRIDVEAEGEARRALQDLLSDCLG
jgi:hypothetical protein